MCVYAGDEQGTSQGGSWCLGWCQAGWWGTGAYLHSQEISSSCLAGLGNVPLDLEIRIRHGALP